MLVISNFYYASYYVFNQGLLCAETKKNFTSNIIKMVQSETAGYETLNAWLSHSLNPKSWSYKTPF